MYIALALGRAKWIERHLHLIDSLVLAPPLIRWPEDMTAGTLLHAYTREETEHIQQDSVNTLDALKAATRVQATRPKPTIHKLLALVQFGIILTHHSSVLAR